MARSKRAAEVINLEKVLDGGPRPSCDTSHKPGSQSGTTCDRHRAHQGSRQGHRAHRMAGQWRHSRRDGAPAGPGPDYEVKQELALDPGENALRSSPMRAAICWPRCPRRQPSYTTARRTRKAETHCARHRHQQIRRPRRAERVAFLALDSGPCPTQRLSRPRWKRRARGYMSEVRVRPVLDEDATPRKLRRGRQRDRGRDHPARHLCVFLPPRMATPMAATTI